MKTTGFIAGLYAASLIPLVSVPVLKTVQHPLSDSALIAFQFVAGYCHVGLTPFFYTDLTLKEFLRSNPKIYFWIPLLIVLSSGLLFAYLPPEAFQNLLLAYFVWQTWHYQKQNLGILSFVAALTKSGRVTSIEKKLLNLGVFAGILGFFKLQFAGQETVLRSQLDLLYNAGLLTIAGLFFLFVYTLFQHSNIVKSPIRLSFLLITTFFYLPTFLFSDPISGISSYALAHGMQYFVFMSFVAKRESATLLIRLFSISAIVGTMLYFCANTKALFGLVPGAAMAHFVVDAHLWKMNQPFQREYLKSAFSFLP